MNRKVYLHKTNIKIQLCQGTYDDIINTHCLLFVIVTGPLISHNERIQNLGSPARTGDRRIDIDEQAQKSISNKTLESGIGSQAVNDYSEDNYEYYEDYERLLKDYYEGDYNEESFNEDDSNIKEESEEELPEITRTPRTPTKDGDSEKVRTKDNVDDQASRPLVGRRILSANPSQLHIENQHEMDHMMMMMLRNGLGWFEQFIML